MFHVALSSRSPAGNRQTHLRLHLTTLYSLSQVSYMYMLTKHTNSFLEVSYQTKTKRVSVCASCKRMYSSAKASSLQD